MDYAFYKVVEEMAAKVDYIFQKLREQEEYAKEKENKETEK